ncbi:hypothetical protein [Nonomuraea sp. NPDC050643]|uniref:hypothetical protein n=1 Tax=Nonomuraea sp. NPDC050643 TaxID=3155660 RepID=UPI0033E0B7A0
MAETVSSIDAEIITATDDSSLPYLVGTDGYVYLGLAGREFLCNTTGNDFESGNDTHYIYGDGANVTEPELNDPRNPALNISDLDHTPAYIRFAPLASDPKDHWLLERVDVTVTGNNGSKVQYSILAGSDRLWLSADSGLTVHLKKI